MANLGLILKTAGSVLAATAAVLTALKENPQLSKTATNALGKVRDAARSRNPKERFEAKLTAIDACATAVDTEFGRDAEAQTWRRQAAALRLRADLAWSTHRGKQRRTAMRTLNEETSTLLDQINHRLASLTDSQAAITADTDE